MAKLTLIHAATIPELASELYNYLPGSGAIITFGTIAHKYGVEKFWIGGSKLPAIQQLLENTFMYESPKFCNLILDIVREGIKYRKKKGNPLTKEDVIKLNNIILKLGFKIPELHEQEFLDVLPKREKQETNEAAYKPAAVFSLDKLGELNKRFSFLFISEDAQRRGYELQTLLTDLFNLFGITAKGAFRLVGEEIDGSFEFEANTYLIEAKWRKVPSGFEDLAAFKVKAEGKSNWTRGLFISINGFTNEGLEAFEKRGATNILCMNGEDISIILECRCTLKDALKLKLRCAAETGKAFVPLRDLI